MLGWQEVCTVSDSEVIIAGYSLVMFCSTYMFTISYVSCGVLHKVGAIISGRRYTLLCHQTDQYTWTYNIQKIKFSHGHCNIATSLCITTVCTAFGVWHHKQCSSHEWKEQGINHVREKWFLKLCFKRVQMFQSFHGDKRTHTYTWQFLMALHAWWKSTPPSWQRCHWITLRAINEV